MADDKKDTPETMDTPGEGHDEPSAGSELSDEKTASEKEMPKASDSKDDQPEQRDADEDASAADNEEPEEELSVAANEAEASVPPAARTAQSTPERGRVGLLIVAAAAGLAGGWFGHQAQAKKEFAQADAAVQGEGDGARGPCKDWEGKLCGELGETSPTCQKAKASSPLLPGSACKLALAQIPATVTKLKEARVACDELVARLCKDLGKETKSCEMVTTQTPNIPAEKCQEMMKNYEPVIGRLRAMEQRGPGRPPMGRPPMPGGPGAPPHGVKLPANQATSPGSPVPAPKSPAKKVAPIKAPAAPVGAPAGTAKTPPAP